ncbi:hypothetical protein ACF09C_16635 [Streptomyces sp. NPDC014870]|uniref:hypothetical protein n=1 Tax=Streptomyces sp. NPDC014870 TaxID=3364925 RepID=UPI003702430B
MPLIDHPSGDYALQIMYALPDDAWYLELDRVADGSTLLIGIVPDEDPDREPTVCVTPPSGHHHVPYEVMRWFMEHLDREIATSRGWMTLRPDLVRTIHRLRLMERDGVYEGDLQALAAVLAEDLPAADLPLVIGGVFGDGDGFAEAAAGEPSPAQVRAVRERMEEWVRDTAAETIG